MLETVHPNIVAMVSNENVPAWINHVFHVISLVSSTRMMCGPVFSFVAVKIIVHLLRRLKFRSIVTCSGKSGRCRSILAPLSDLPNKLGTYIPTFPINQASFSWIALQPVVYVAFDKNLFAKLFPQREPYSVVICFVQWRVVEIGTFTLEFTGQFGLGVIAFDLIIFKVTLIRESIAPH